MEKKVRGNFTGNSEVVLMNKAGKNQIYANAVAVYSNAQKLRMTESKDDCVVKAMTPDSGNLSSFPGFAISLQLCARDLISLCFFCFFFSPSCTTGEQLCFRLI